VLHLGYVVLDYWLPSGCVELMSIVTESVFVQSHHFASLHTKL